MDVNGWNVYLSEVEVEGGARSNSALILLTLLAASASPTLHLLQASVPSYGLVSSPGRSLRDSPATNCTNSPWVYSTLEGGGGSLIGPYLCLLQ